MSNSPSARWHGRRRISLCSAGIVIALGALLVGGCSGTAGPSHSGAPRSSIDWNAVVARQITDTRAHLTLPELMEASTLLMFQPLGDGHAAVNGDYAMTADRSIR